LKAFFFSFRSIYLLLYLAIHCIEHFISQTGAIHGRDRMVIWFTTPCTLCSYQH